MVAENWNTAQEPKGEILLIGSENTPGKIWLRAVAETGHLLINSIWLTLVSYHDKETPFKIPDQSTAVTEVKKFGQLILAKMSIPF